MPAWEVKLLYYIVANIISIIRYRIIEIIRIMKKYKKIRERTFLYNLKKYNLLQ